MDFIHLIFMRFFAVSIWFEHKNQIRCGAGDYRKEFATIFVTTLRKVQHGTFQQY